MTEFAQATSVTSEGDGVYTAHVPPDWNAPVLPHGGIVVSAALRAAEAELGAPDQTLRTVNAVFAGQVHPGPAVIEVRVLRRGRSISQVAVDLRNVEADAGHHVVAVYGATRPGFEFTEIAMPDVLPVEEARPFEPPPDRDPSIVTFWDHADGRLALGNYWDDVDWEPNGSSDRAYWYRFQEPPRLDDGSLDPLALVAFCDTMPGSVFQRMGPGMPEGFCPSADLTVHLFQPSTSEWLLAHNTARHVGDGYASIDQRLWDPAVGLVAYGTQVAFFSFTGEPPSPDQIRPPR